MGLFDFFKSKKPSLSSEARDAVAQVALVAFPGGEKQITEETDQLHALRGCSEFCVNLQIV